MRILVINKSDSTGGAAIVTTRLISALRREGVDVRMLVAEKSTELDGVTTGSNALLTKGAFLAERLKIFISNGFNRADLFKIDTASDGLPLWKHPWVKEADVVVLNWFNQGFLSLKGIRKIAALGKPIVWTMHDMWAMTGICHHAGGCTGFRRHCGNCHFLGKNKRPDDLSNRVWKQKLKIYDKIPIRFVAVSNWLASKARESGLLRNADLMVIPNAFPIDESKTSTAPAEGTCKLVMGAARLDDPIKGFPILVRAMHLLAEKHPEVIKKIELVTFGSIGNPELLKQFPASLKHTYLGRLKGEGALRRVYDSASVVVSPSLFETLPGTLVEGQAYGCVPVAFDHGGQRDIISHERTGYLCSLPSDFSGTDVGRMHPEQLDFAAASLTEGILWAVANQTDEIRARMFRNVTDKFSARAVARRYISLFESLLEESHKK